MKKKDVIIIILELIGICLYIICFIQSNISKQTKIREYTELKEEYEEYVKENEWKNEYIEWLQDRLYKYEGDVSYEIQ